MGMRNGRICVTISHSSDPQRFKTLWLIRRRCTASTFHAFIQLATAILTCLRLHSAQKISRLEMSFVNDNPVVLALVQK